MFKYFPHTEEDIKGLLEAIGVSKIDDLFSQIDPMLLHDEPLNLPSSHSEDALRKEMNRLGNKNKELISFLGAGSYDVMTPSVCSAITSRQEFLTSYTPYQPEISQGTLQYIFEWQSMICELTGMDVTNASMYDGATATAEAMFMATSQMKKNKILVSSTINPNTLDVIKTYAKYRGIEVVEVKGADGVTSLDHLKEVYDDEVCGLIVMQPNFYGIIEDYDPISGFVKENGGLLIMNADPSTLSVLKSPRQWGADIACGEAQSLGISLSNGGPYLGYLATTDKLLRKLPGRICGITEDVDGKRGFVLTLQAREQHIRREKANSNICSNQSLMALQVVIYMSLLGKRGLKEVALTAYQNAHYLYEKLLELPGFTNKYNQTFFKEFLLAYDGSLKKLNNYLLKKGYLSGLIINDNCLLLCATEKRTKEEIDEFVRLVGEYNVR